MTGDERKGERKWEKYLLQRLSAKARRVDEQRASS